MKSQEVIVWKVNYPDGSICHFGTYGTAKAYSYGGTIEKVTFRRPLELVEASTGIYQESPAQALAAGLVEDLFKTIDEYHGSILLSTAIGCLEMVKEELLKEHKREIEE